MMREILFRGKTRTGEWVQGDYEHFEANGITYPMISVWGEFNKDVIHKTVGQYTGLTDRNGTKIFEGDIVKADGYIFTVKFGKCGGVANDDNFGYMGFYFEGFDEITKKCMDLGLRKDICCFVNREVIGNIHDNPELLKGDKSDA